MIRGALVIIAFILLADRTAWAHPHVYVVYSVVLPLGSESVERIGFVFTFDVLFSAILLRDAGQGDAETVSRNHAKMLEQIPHEIEVSFNGAPVALESPTDLQVSTAGGRVTYRFMMPLRTPVRSPGTIDITVDDPGVFAAFVVRTPGPVDVEGAGALTAVCDRVQKPSGAPGPIRCEYGRAQP